MMYTENQLAQLHAGFPEVTAQLQDLQLATVTQARTATADPDVRKYLNHGVGRRLGILRKALEEIYRLFPPEQPTPLPRDDLLVTQIHLQAFILNVSGVFDNWAWAFVHRHNLFEAIGDRRRVGMFLGATQVFLPPVLREYVQQPQVSSWHDTYQKGYRDALAHRIPVYIPPARWTDAEAARYEVLEQLKVELIQAHEWQELHEVWAEQDQLGSPCPLFVHEYPAQGAAAPMLLHPQLLSDAKTVTDFGARFYAAWHERQLP
jgi:hypothetical protein